MTAVVAVAVVSPKRRFTSIANFPFTTELERDQIKRDRGGTVLEHSSSELKASYMKLSCLTE